MYRDMKINKISENIISFVSIFLGVCRIIYFSQLRKHDRARTVLDTLNFSLALLSRNMIRFKFYVFSLPVKYLFNKTSL